MANNLTAVEFLAEQIDLGLSENGLKSVIQQAKEMEKKQIIDAWFDGTSNWDNTDDYYAKHYYEKTFNK